MYKELIMSIKPFSYNQYKDISSNEKLSAYACYFLREHDIPLTFTYICVSCFKMFPEKFYLDEEFKEYPHVEKLNRTILHMYTNKTSKFLVGSTKTGYKLTKSGLIIAKQVESDLLNKKADSSIKRVEIMDTYKKGVVQDYNRLIQSHYYQNFDVNNDNIDKNFLWKHYDVIPFTQLEKIESNIKIILNYANSINDNKCIDFCYKIYDLLESLKKDMRR